MNHAPNGPSHRLFWHRKGSIEPSQRPLSTLPVSPERPRQLTSCPPASKVSISRIVQGSKFKVQGSRFKVQGSKFKVQEARFKAGRVIILVTSHFSLVHTPENLIPCHLPMQFFSVLCRCLYFNVKTILFIAMNHR